MTKHVAVKKSDLDFMIGWINSFVEEVQARNIVGESIDLSRAEKLVGDYYDKEPINWYKLVEENDGAWIKDGDSYIFGPYSKSESEAVGEYMQLVRDTVVGDD